MSEQNWKPGDVATVAGEVAIRVRYGSDEAFVDASGRHWRNEDETARPLVVIDPAADIPASVLAAFKDAWHKADGQGRAGERVLEGLTGALREFASPTPPRPEEPLGLGAVVEDAEGGRWIKIDEHSDCNDWVDLGAHSHKPDGERETVRHSYRDITAVKVLSAGVVA